MKDVALVIVNHFLIHFTMNDDFTFNLQCNINFDIRFLY